MRLIRIKAYIIDFAILACIIFTINAAFPHGHEYNHLKAEQNSIMEDRLSNKISFDEYVESYSEVFYKVAKEEQIPYFLYFIFMIVYFVVIPYKWRGRTLGCYICNVQVERFDNDKLRVWQLFVRHAFTFGIAYVLVNTICLIVLPSSRYFLVISVVAFFQIVLAIFSGITVLIKSEKRGLHELVSNTELTKIIEPKRKR